MSDVQNSSDGREDARAKFREALDRKKKSSGARRAHEEGRMKVKGMSGPLGQKRYTRRKTG